jgi:hypothetical protein
VSDDGAHEGASHPSAARRALLVTAAVLTPIALGALATLVLYATRANPAAAAPHSSAVTDTELHDGQILIIQPRNANTITIPIGQIVEIIMETGAGQSVESDNLTTLAPIINPPCHIFPICELPGADTWTFQAVNAGLVHLRITFGAFACPPAKPCPQTAKSPASLNKPVAIYARPQNT